MKIEYEQDVKCSNCKFHYETMGQCRRYPPQVLVDLHFTTEIRHVFPRVKDEDFCGEFKTK